MIRRLPEGRAPGWLNIPGPRHSRNDRSLGVCIDPNAPDGFYIHSFAGDNETECRAYVKSQIQELNRKGAYESTLAPTEKASYRVKRAMELWEMAEPPQGTVVEAYLAHRQCRLEPVIVADVIRFHPSLRHPSGDAFPAMVALVQGIDGEPRGIHRTFLARDGRGKAPVKPEKMMLGPCGGGAVRLSPAASSSLLVGEGIETCLSAMQATGRPTWAALSTSGLRSLDLPPEVRDVVVLADGDDPGEQAARDAAIRWHRQGRRVRIGRPPRGFDFNDWLLGRSTSDAEK